MRIWVSGARGKLGSEVQRQLEAARHQVVPADLAGEEPVDLTDPAAVAASMRGAESASTSRRRRSRTTSTTCGAMST